MSVGLSVLKRGIKVSIGQVISQAGSFLRSLILARLIGPSDFAIAAIFAMTYSLMEMISNLSCQTLLVQAEDGDIPLFQKTAQLLQAGRGIVNAALTFIIAGPVSQLFSVSRAKWAFQVIALVPLIRGFNHLDLNRMQREMRFGPGVAADVFSAVLVTLAVFPLAYGLRNYSAMLWLLVLQSAIYAAASHIVAERRYAWGWDRSYSGRMFNFGWPLLLNGLLIYGIFEGDRFIIGAAHRLFPRSSLTLADLGVYSAAFALTMAPTMLIANVGSTLLLPHLARVQKEPERFERRYTAYSQIISLLATSISIPFIAAGGRLVVLIYGQKYAAATGFIGWLGAMWALRIIRVAPTVAAMALGDTKNAMVSNIARTGALVGALMVAASGRGLLWITLCGFLGELLALATSVWRLERHHAVPATVCLKPLAIVVLSMTMAGLASLGGIARFGWLPALLFTASLVSAQVVLMLFAFPVLRRDLAFLIVKFQRPMAAREVSA
jgi:O-antigen/teichoic acid export membrane protein